MAAEILIKAMDDDTLGGWSRGDPIDIRPGGYAWGTSEGDPRISYVVVITDVDPAELARYLVPRYDLAAEPDPETGLRPVLEPRLYYAHGTPLDWQEELMETGRIVRTWAEVAPFVINKDTGASEAGVVLV